MGGNIFKGKYQTSPIKREWIKPTLDNYFTELKSIFPKKSNILNLSHFHTLGSVGKKDYSGDIDLGIDASLIAGNDFDDKSLKDWNLDPKAVKDEFLKLKKRARSATDSQLMLKATLKGIVDQINKKSKFLVQDEKKITPSNIFGAYTQFDSKDNRTDKWVQLDWMVGDIELLDFSYYSEEYTGNVKGLHRTQLLIAMFQAMNYSFSHAKGLTDKATGEMVATKPKEIVEKLEELYGIKLSKDTMKNYFKLSEVVLKLPKDLKDKILDEYFKILQYTRTDIPENIQDDWKRLNKKNHYETKFLPPNSKLLESIGFNAIYKTIIEG